MAIQDYRERGTECFTVCNSRRVLSDLSYHNVSINHVTDGNYTYKESVFQISLQENARFTYEPQINNTLLLLDHIAGNAEDITFVMNKIIEACNANNSAAIILPCIVSRNDQDKAVNRELLAIIKEFELPKFDHAKVETRINEKVPLFVYESPTYPHSKGLAAYLENKEG